jgi:hypothetical protein
MRLELNGSEVRTYDLHDRLATRGMGIEVIATDKLSTDTAIYRMEITLSSAQVQRLIAESDFIRAH